MSLCVSRGVFCVSQIVSCVSLDFSANLSVSLSLSLSLLFSLSTLGRFTMCFMRAANCSVDAVCESCAAMGQILATMSVMQFPPRESFRTWVSLLWRKGMWDRFFLSVSARTTCSRKLSDLLMYIASVRTWEGPWG